jgi:hypothetical protein
MKMILQITTLLALVGIAVHLASAQETHQAAFRESKTQSKLSRASAPTLQDKVYATQPAQRGNYGQQSLFEVDLTKARHILSDAEDDLDPRRAQDNFRKSGSDSQQNYAEAHQILRQKYTIPLTRHEAERRVLALHFLGASELFLDEDCLTTLEIQIDHYSRSAEKIKTALIWDIYGLAQLCARSGGEGVNALAMQTNIREIQAQIKLAVAKVGAEGIRTN